jgi:hypothetical protein
LRKENIQTKEAAIKGLQKKHAKVSTKAEQESRKNMVHGAGKDKTAATVAK